MNTRDAKSVQGDREVVRPCAEYALCASEYWCATQTAGTLTHLADWLCSFSELPNFTAADVVRVLGVGRVRHTFECSIR